MSMIDNVTDNLIKAGVAVGICDTAEIRKLKVANEKSKLEAEMKNREDEVIKSHAKCMKEMDELTPSFNAAMLYATLKTDNMDMLLKYLKSKENSKIIREPKPKSKFERVRTDPKPAPSPEAEGLAG